MDAPCNDFSELQSKLLHELSNIPSIDKTWIFKSLNGKSSQVMFSLSQANILSNKRRKFVLSASVIQETGSSIKFEWARFPTEMTGVSAMVPSPSGSKLFIVRNPEKESSIHFEIWDDSHLIKEVRVPQSVHGSVYAEKWFEGISWDTDESLIAYVAEEPASLKPIFDCEGYRKSDDMDSDSSSWKGQGEWEQDWGETYAGKRKPALFVLNTNTGEVKPVKGIPGTLSVGQVVWAPGADSSTQSLVFVGWTTLPKKLGIKYCYNRPCSLNSAEDSPAVNLTPNTNSAYFPHFSPNGKILVYVSSSRAVDTGAHCATNSLHRIDWDIGYTISSCTEIIEVVPVVQYAEEGCFPGLYCSSLLSQPWLSDSHTLILSSNCRSSEVILSVNVLSKEVKQITPANSACSWKLIALDDDAVIAVSSSLVKIPEINYGFHSDFKWSWTPISSPLFKISENISSRLALQKLSIVKIPVRKAFGNVSKGANQPYEAILVSNTDVNGDSNPLIVTLHGGPHSVFSSAFAKSMTYLNLLGFNLLIVNYRGSVGFGEEALQSLPGNVGSQDVDDVLAAIDHVINTKIASPRGMALLGGSHGGFLTTHLIGQAPDRFFAAAARNPVCNIALMVGTTDIPDWCFFETYKKREFTETPSADELAHLLEKSPIAHISRVKTPTLFMIGARDLRVPMSNGIQYARALKERGVDVKIMVFPEDVHGIDRPQSDFECYMDIASWFKKHYLQ